LSADSQFRDDRESRFSPCIFLSTLHCPPSTIFHSLDTFSHGCSVDKPFHTTHNNLEGCQMAIQLPDKHTLSRAVYAVLEKDCSCESWHPENASEFSRAMIALSGTTYETEGSFACALHRLIDALHPRNREQWCLLYVALTRIIGELFECSACTYKKIISELDALMSCRWAAVSV
jgi:hypothetical protein